jgi:hypothetical protein
MMESNEIKLNEEQRKSLVKFTKSGVHSAMEIRRARAILALDRTNKKDHLRVGRICETVGLSRQGLNEIRKEYMQSKSIEEFLSRKKRETPPVPAKITGEVEAHIVALACSEPPSGRSRWTVRLLAEKAVELHYVESLSHMSIARLLKKRSINLT